MNDMADDTWDNKARNRISAIHFLDEDEEEDDEKVRASNSRTGCCQRAVTKIHFEDIASIALTRPSSFCLNSNESSGVLSPSLLARVGFIY